MIAFWDKTRNDHETLRHAAAPVSGDAIFDGCVDGLIVRQDSDNLIQGGSDESKRCSRVDSAGRGCLIDQDGWWLASGAEEDLALTLFAVASEDPANWQEISAYWPRYRSPAVAEFAEGTALHPADELTARSALAQTDRWLVIDLVRKRITSGKDFELVGRDQVFAMEVDEKGDQHWPMSIHLPPWWELTEQATVDAIDKPRDEPIRRPRPNRAVLFGEPMIEDLAGRILRVSRSQAWHDRGAATDRKTRYPFTIEIHRDWLMTPRRRLGGKNAARNAAWSDGLDRQTGLGPAIAV